MIVEAISVSYFARQQHLLCCRDDKTMLLIMHSVSPGMQNEGIPRKPTTSFIYSERNWGSQIIGFPRPHRWIKYSQTSYIAEGWVSLWLKCNMSCTKYIDNKKQRDRARVRLQGCNIRTLNIYLPPNRDLIGLYTQNGKDCYIEMFL